VTDPAWDRFACALSATIAAFVLGDTLILRQGRRFVQVAHGRIELLAEAVTNETLPADEKLSAAQERQLTESGWHLPSPSTTDNYWP
jgi:hypothetical protein